MANEPLREALRKLDNLLEEVRLEKVSINQAANRFELLLTPFEGIEEEDYGKLQGYVHHTFFPSLFRLFEHDSSKFLDVVDLFSTLESVELVIFTFVEEMAWEFLSTSDMLPIYVFEASPLFVQRCFRWSYSSLRNMYSENNYHEENMPITNIESNEKLVSMLVDVMGKEYFSISGMIRYSDDIADRIPGSWHSEPTIDRCMFVSRLQEELHKHLVAQGQIDSGRFRMVNPLKMFL